MSTRKGLSTQDLSRTRRWSAVAVVLLALFLVSACTRGEAERFFADPNKPIEAKIGQAFVVVLPAQEAGNAEWTLTQEIDPALLQLTASRETEVHYFNTPDEERNQEYWIFMALGAGDAEIHLDYVDTAGRVLESRVFQVQVTR